MDQVGHPMLPLWIQTIFMCAYTCTWVADELVWVLWPEVNAGFFLFALYFLR